MILLSDISSALDRLYPPRWAESWDNTGLTVGRFGAEISRIMLSLDVTRETVDEALGLQCDLLLTHHPFPWRERRRFDLAEPETMLLARILAGGLNLFAVHTNLDSAPNSHAVYLASRLGLINTEPLKYSLLQEPGVGLGRVGDLASPTPISELITRFKAVINVQSLMVAGFTNQRIMRAAICPGAAGDFIGLAIATGAQLLIGAEFTHHEVLYALANGLVLIEAGHFATELPAVQILSQNCHELFHSQKLEILIARREQNPLTLL